MRAPDTLLVTGATGLVGSGVVTRLLRAHPALHVAALARDPARLAAVAAREGWGARVLPVPGDVALPGLGLASLDRTRLARTASAVLHCAADTVFSRPLAEARRTNTDGTRHLLEVVDAWRRPVRVAHVSTAFVAGRATGDIAEGASDGAHGWVNGYERSKWEAEALVRAHAPGAVVLRSSTIVADTDGTVRQHNAVHRALRAYHAGLAAMLPGTPGGALDTVPGDWTCDAIARLALAPDAAGLTFHLCAGAGALPLDELLDRTWARWARDESWRRRGVARPAIADLGTWTLFERSVHETGNARLTRVLSALSHFVPQLALPKRFETANVERLLGAGAPPVRDYWDAMLADLLASSWGARAAGGERAA